MITIDKDQVTVKFAETIQQGEIHLESKNNYITLKDLNVHRKVGERCSTLDGNDIPSVTLAFNTVESIEVLERHLAFIKHNIKYPYGILPVCA